MELKLDYIDKDEKYIDFTQKNIDLINFCLSVDSSYRNAFDEEYEGSSAELIKKHWKFDEETITKICQQIDKENSTHLAVSGHKKDAVKDENGYSENNKGVIKVVERIMKTPNIETRIQNADAELVNEIAGAVDGVSKFSFASKFCTYVSRYKFENNNDYAIYDKVISEILPYYESIYLGKSEHIKKGRKYISSTMERDFANVKKYGEYNALIGKIIKAINDKKKLEIDRKTFDRILWYYYKGDEKLRQDALNEIPL